MDAFKDQLFEFPVTFLPSYPFEENCLDGQSYMKTRCPAWCDRVLLSVTAKQLISEVSITTWNNVFKNQLMRLFCELCSERSDSG